MNEINEKTLADMVSSWVAHGLISACMDLPFLLLHQHAGVNTLPGVVFGAAFYIGREVGQHQVKGTKGLQQWIDRIVDALVAVAVSAVFWAVGS